MNYNLYLPVYKQGEDFAFCLEEANNNPIVAFNLLAERYKLAAQICQEVSDHLSHLKEISKIKVHGDTHCIFITAPKKMVATLVAQEILSEDDF